MIAKQLKCEEFVRMTPLENLSLRVMKTENGVPAVTRVTHATMLDERTAFWGMTIAVVDNRTSNLCLTNKVKR